MGGVGSGLPTPDGKTMAKKNVKTMANAYVEPRTETHPHPQPNLSYQKNKKNIQRPDLLYPPQKYKKQHNRYTDPKKKQNHTHTEKDGRDRSTER